MYKANYHLTIINNNQNFYFQYEYIATGDIIKIGGYRVVVNKKFNAIGLPYTQLSVSLVNEGDITISGEQLGNRIL